MAFLETSAQAYCSKPVRGGSFHATGSVIIHDGGARQMNFLFARKKNAVYSLAFVAKGGFTLYEKRGYGEGGRVISSQAGPKLEAGVAIDFDIRCFERTLTVAIGDSSWEIQLPRELPEEIIWGVGAQASSDEMGAFGVWRNVRVDGG